MTDLSPVPRGRTDSWVTIGMFAVLGLYSAKVVFIDNAGLPFDFGRDLFTNIAMIVSVLGIGYQVAKMMDPRPAISFTESGMSVFAFPGANRDAAWSDIASITRYDGRNSRLVVTALGRRDDPSQTLWKPLSIRRNLCAPDLAKVEAQLNSLWQAYR